MRKDEFNDYKITNPDGTDSAKYNDGKVVYQNDEPGYVNEYPTSEVREEFKVKETFDSKERTSSTQRKSNSSSQQTSSMTSASSATSAVSSAASSIGSSIGAFAGMVASAVVTAVIVVAVFISSMTIDLSLVMANTDSIVVQLDISGAQDEDFEEAIIATIESSDGEYQEQVVTKDTLYVTFNNLKPGKEYFVSVKNKDKVFAEKSFFTSKTDIDRGQMTTRYDDNVAIISVSNVSLKSNEFYTITARDAQGNVVFSKDSKNPNDVFKFNVDSQTKLYFSLAVNGATYTVSELDPAEVTPPDEGTDPVGPDQPVTPGVNPEYDYSHGEWTWASDYSKASIMFVEIHGQDPYVVEVDPTSEQTAWPDCENPGSITYTAVLEAFDNVYNDTKVVDVPALGHDFTPEFRWNTSDLDNVTASVVLTCSRDYTHEHRGTATVASAVDTTGECGSEITYTYTSTYVYEGETFTDTYVTRSTVAHEPENLSDATFDSQETFNAKVDQYSGLLSGSPKLHYTCHNCGEEITENCVVESKTFGVASVTYTVSCHGLQHEYVVYDRVEFTDATLEFEYDEELDGMVLVGTSMDSTASAFYESRLDIPSKLYGKNIVKIGEDGIVGTKYEIISMPNTVKEIGPRAFSGNTAMTTVILSDALDTIGSEAFKNCTSLESVVFPVRSYYNTGILTLSEGVFAGCTSLQSLTIPVGKVEWFGRLFGTSSVSGTTGISDPFTSTTYYLPTSLTTLTLDTGSDNTTGGIIGEKEFYGITTIQTVIFGARSASDATSVSNYGVKTIGQSAFENCTGLTTVDIKEVQTIGSAAFKGCTALTSMTLPSSVTTIGANFLAGCNHLQTLVVPFIGNTSSDVVPLGYTPEKTSDTYLLGYFFGTTSSSGMTTGVSQKSASDGTSKTYYIPSTLTSVTVTGSSNKVGIYYGAFMNCGGIETIVLGSNVTVIIPEAFSGTTNLGSVVFEDGDASYFVYDTEGATAATYTSEDLADSTANATAIKNTAAGYRWSKRV